MYVCIYIYIYIYIHTHTPRYISKASNGEIEAKRPILEQRDGELQMCFSPIETFHPRHGQCPTTLAACEIGP